MGKLISTSNRNNIANSAFNFPGQDTSFVDITISETLKISKAITITGWHFIDGGMVNPMLIGCEGGSNIYTIYSEGTSNTSRNIVAYFGGWGNGLGSGPVPALSWQHFAFKYDETGNTKFI